MASSLRDKTMEDPSEAEFLKEQALQIKATT